MYDKDVDLICKVSEKVARPYAQEIEKLTETLAWAGSASIDDLARAVRTAALGPLVAVGSGGSLSAAHFLAQVHQSLSGQLGQTATPSELLNAPAPRSAAIWLLSAGGSNVDINGAFDDAVAREPRQLAVLCGRAQSRLSDTAQQHSYCDLLLYELPAGKDGFLATNSLFGFCALILRAYLAATQASADWDAIEQQMSRLLSVENQTMWRNSTEHLWGRSTTVVLHSPNARVGAIDLESKFTEAAIGNLHYADWRNFAHGRHHWLAKRGRESAIIALIGDDEPLAERTLALIPDDIPVSRLRLPGPPEAASLGALAASLLLTGWAGEARGIDPGRPGVPEFGRKLYGLPLKKSAKSRRDAEIAAIERKAFASHAQLVERGQLTFWQSAYNDFNERLHAASFAGAVLDYDGTIVDARARTLPPEKDLVQIVVRLIEDGLVLAIATGRGKSVRLSLREVLPKPVWSRVTIGYYNGLEIAPLSEDGSPNDTTRPTEALASVAARLRAQPEVSLCAEQTDRAHQITLEPKHSLREDHLWLLAQQAILSEGASGVRVVRSSHSIDIIDAKRAKGAVVDAMRNRVGNGAILCVGDRGRWPGNDHELLAEPLSLSVDEVNLDPATCWHLGSEGSRGPSVLLEYLRRLRPRDGRFLWE
jgi:fructoselysine-6-P-deglycase FrlB-like protein/trehalose-6-phosphatase